MQVQSETRTGKHTQRTKGAFYKIFQYFETKNMHISPKKRDNPLFITFSIPERFISTKRSSKKSFWYCKTKKNSPQKIVIPLLRMKFFPTRNFPKHRKDNPHASRICPVRQKLFCDTHAMVQ